MDRPHPVAILVKNQASEQMHILLVRVCPSGWSLFRQEILRRIECLFVDDGLMLAVVDLFLVPDPADVDRIGQQMVELAR